MFRSTLSARSSGPRSCSAPLEQNSPTLLVENDDTTSGGLPPRIALRIFVSSWPLTSLTVMFGCRRRNPATASLNAFTSCGALQPCQTSMVCGASAFGPDGLAGDWLPAVQAAAVAVTSMAVAIRRGRGNTRVSLGPQGLSGEDLVACPAEREVQRAGQDG